MISDEIEEFTLQEMFRDELMSNDENSIFGYNIKAVKKGSVILEITVENWQNVLTLINDTKSMKVRDQIINYAAVRGLRIASDKFEVDVQIQYNEEVFSRKAGKTLFQLHICYILYAPV